MSLSEVIDNECPYYRTVPKDFNENVKFRGDLLANARKSKDSQKKLRRMCAQDILFYINGFCTTYDPRRKPSMIPFITYKFQDEAIIRMVLSIGNNDLLIEKSRDMGASWMLLTVFEWFWHFKQNQSFLLGSRKEDYVDRLGDPKSLFWKIDFLHKNLPKWLLPRMDRKILAIVNKDNGSTINGESTNSDFARGDRRTAIGLDEFASVDNGYEILAATADVTNCRIFNSTPKGTGNAFYDQKQNHECAKLTLHWSLHPDKAKGLYVDSKGKSRSPWYDREVLRRATTMEVAQELDIDYQGSGQAFFDQIMLNEIKSLCCDPYETGDLTWNDRLEPRWLPECATRMRLWFYPDADGNPPKDRTYSVGVDISTGKAGEFSSCSAISVLDKKTGEKVAEFSDASINPTDLAVYAVAMCYWFMGLDDEPAFMVWEDNGPGGAFGKEVIEQGFRNFYYRRNEQQLSRRRGNVPGWWTTAKNKRVLLADYAKALKDGTFSNKSKEALAECEHYVYLPGGKVEHTRASNSPDPSGAGENHGDRTIADALAHFGRGEKTQYLKEKEEVKRSTRCYAARRDERNRPTAEEVWVV